MVVVDPKVIMFPDVPVQLKVPEIVWVVEAVSVNVLGGLMVTLVNVLEPEIMTAPDPEPVIEKL